jgi:hypothetical protein
MQQYQEARGIMEQRNNLDGHQAGLFTLDEEPTLDKEAGELVAILNCTPTEYARGPWSPNALHGGPVAALFARSMEAVPAETMERPLLARLTVELERPVGLAPIQVRTRLVRPGYKVELLDALASQAGKVVARARGLRLRQLTEAGTVPEVGLAKGHIGAPETSELADWRPKPPQENAGSSGNAGPLENAGSSGNAGPSATTTPEGHLSKLAATEGSLGEQHAFHRSGVEIRFARGSFQELGSAMVWIKLLTTVIEGEEPTPAQRAAASADFSNGVSAEVPFDQWRYINPEVSIHLTREPQGEWIGLDARTVISPTGIGLATSTMWDREHLIGHAAQELIVEPWKMG